MGNRCPGRCSQYVVGCHQPRSGVRCSSRCRHGALFIARLLVINGVADENTGMAYFIRTIPYNFYAWFAVILSLFVVLGWVPPLGGLKKAEQRVAQGGAVAPEGSEKIDIHADGEKLAAPPQPTDGSISFCPWSCSSHPTLLTDLDMQMGVIITLAFMFILYISQGIMTAEEFADHSVGGLRNMVMPLLLMVLAFLFSYAADRIQFTKQVIDSVLPFMSPQTMPVLVFLVLTATEFITGTNWGMYIIALPIVIPLSQVLGAHTLLSICAVLSAGVFGSHICFYSDATILSSAASGCSNFAHATSQLPYGSIAVLFSRSRFFGGGNYDWVGFGSIRRYPSSSENSSGVGMESMAPSRITVTDDAADARLRASSMGNPVAMDAI